MQVITYSMLRLKLIHISKRGSKRLQGFYTFAELVYHQHITQTMKLCYLITHG